MPQATSSVGIANLALSRIGGKPITSLEEASVIAQLCSKNYDPARIAMLESFPWSFAKTRASLPALAAAPAWGPANAYQLPADCVWVVELDIPADVAWHVEGRTIVTDAAAPLKILYIRDETDPVAFSALFVDAMADQLAGEIAFGITKDIRYRTPFMQTAQLKAQSGKTRDSQEASTEVLVSDALIAVRMGGGSSNDVRS
jgi:hypothetical protein